MSALYSFVLGAVAFIAFWSIGMATILAFFIWVGILAAGVAVHFVLTGVKSPRDRVR